MKLLVLTQKVDSDDDVLGFFHDWLIKLSDRFESIVVICLNKGKYSLPANVKVFSLGKENGQSKIKYILNFYKYIFGERNNYDKVFVHMNQEYVLLGGIFWKLFKKKVFFWRNHPNGGIFTRLAIMISDKVFCTSKFSYTAKFSKTIVMPVGIDTDKFTPSQNIDIYDERKILYLGRISPIKRLEVLINASNKFDEGTEVHIYGNPSSGSRKYYESLKELSKKNKAKCIFFDGIKNGEVIDVYRLYPYSVNMTVDGSLDKTIFEHMACGGVVLCSNESVASMLDDGDRELLIFRSGSVDDLSLKLDKVFDLNKDIKIELGLRLRRLVVERHSLERLISSLYESFERTN